MERVVYKDDSGNVFFDKTYFTPQEVKSAAQAMFKKQKHPTFSTVKDLYDDLCYLLGAHYWGNEYAWDNKTGETA